ncbi:hypothetical protein T484DRAFT_1765218, partial [Baffinella frigidus]
MLALQKEIISLTDPGKALYDAAVDKFDPGMSEARLVDIFAKFDPGMSEARLVDIFAKFDPGMSEARLVDIFAKVYDAAVDKFDPGRSEARLVDIFAKVKADLAPLIKQVAAKVKANPSLNEVKAPLRGGPDWVPSQQAAMCK